MKKILLVLLLLGVFVSLFAYYQYNRKPTSTDRLKSDEVLTSMSLLALYQENEKEADTKYLDKILEVSGSVGKVTNENEVASIYLQSDDPLSGIIAEMAESEDVTNLQKGDKVVLKGRCTGMLMDVVLVNCVQIEK